MYSYVAPSRPVFYELLCIDVSDRRIKSRWVWLIADYSAHHHLRKDTACIQLLRRPAQHSATIDKKHHRELQSRAIEVKFSQWFAVTRRWRVRRAFGGDQWEIQFGIDFMLWGYNWYICAVREQNYWWSNGLDIRWNKYGEDKLLLYHCLLELGTQKWTYLNIMYHFRQPV
jgi:hypothetical protein